MDSFPGLCPETVSVQEDFLIGKFSKRKKDFGSEVMWMGLLWQSYHFPQLMTSRDLIRKKIRKKINFLTNAKHGIIINANLRMVCGGKGV